MFVKSGLPVAVGTSTRSVPACELVANELVKPHQVPKVRTEILLFQLNHFFLINSPFRPGTWWFSGRCFFNFFCLERSLGWP